MLGEALSRLNNPQVAHVDSYAKDVERFLGALEVLDLSATRAAAGPLGGCSIPHGIHTGSIPQLASEQLRATMRSVSRTLDHEAGKQQMLWLRTGDVSNTLRELPDKLKLSPNQLHLLGETVRCIECEAYRAAAVMGWNLAYDYIRQWVFDNRFVDFNSSLTALYPAKRAIADYADFFLSDAPSEYQILTVCHHPQMPNGPAIGGKLFDDLRQHLRLRNQYAHASDIMASAHKINSYLENLIDIITRAPFN